MSLRCILYYTHNILYTAVAPILLCSFLLRKIKENFLVCAKKNFFPTLSVKRKGIKISLNKITQYISSYFWRDDMMNNEVIDNKTTGIVENSNLNNSNENEFFHAVYIPTDDSTLPQNQLHVYTNKLEALQIIKEHKSGRLKTFKSKFEAEDYARHGSQEIKNRDTKVESCVVGDEKPSLYKGPKSQEHVVFRKLIEEGDLEAVKKTMWENPRYVISSGDTPAILKEGYRYNALHIATSKCKKNAAEMCKLILDTVGDPEFVGLLYGKNDNTYVNRAQILVDLYLNTPDKGLNETPLHFAVKYGYKDIAKVLLSYPQCMKNLENKYHHTPFDIICQRKCQEDKQLKHEIRMLFEDQYYVPVLRSEDNTLQPTIGDPFSPTSPPRVFEDPISPRMEVKAFAGPMTKPQAVEFRKKWKTPPRKLFATTPTKDHVSMNNSFNCLTSPKAQNLGMRLQDTEKGLERVGRELAEEYHVSWKEYWPFLNDFVDLRCDEGLAVLEKYLMTKITAEKSIANSKESDSRVLATEENVERDNSRPVEQKLMKDFVEKLSHACEQLQVNDEMLNKSADDIDMLVKELKKCSLDRPDGEDDEFYTPPNTPEELSQVDGDESSDDEMFVAEEGTPVFIEGENPGKTDFAVLNAIPDIVDSEIYPHIYQWRHEMQLMMRREPKELLCITPRRRPVNQSTTRQLNVTFEKL